MRGVQLFTSVDSGGVWMHTGDPTCDAAHAALLAMLNHLGTPFLAHGSALSNSQKGNMGEFISYQIALIKYPQATHTRFSGNALNPLSRISGAGVDLVYLYLDQTDPANDILYIQEVKTTSANNLDYFDNLSKDYKKLFGVDPNLTLASRVQHVQNVLEFDRGDAAAASRVATLAALSPAKCTRIRLLPTGISSKDVGDPQTKLSSIRSAISVFGWEQGQIEPWSIVMADLDDRLARMSQGRP